MGSGHAHNHHHHDHAHGHAHGHSHGHGHSHAPADFGTAFLIGIILNSAFVVIEATYGFLSGSMALIADAGHNLSDVLALLLAWAANIAARKPANARYTYGYKSSTILAALANAMLLAVAIGAIAFETVHRMIDPVEPQGMVMIIVAGIGILINAGTALLFLRGRHSDLNIRGAFLHMVADALISLGVVIAGVAILFTQQSWIDPAASLMILAVIAWGTWGLARDSLRMGLLGVPDHIDEAAVAEHLGNCPGVAAVHDLHIWPMSTTETALTAHLVMPEGHPGDAALAKLSHELSEAFGIQHTTLQVEMARDACDAAC